MRLVDYLGGDARIVQAARVSYGEGTKSVREDAALIDYLLRHQHTSPFEQVILTFHLKMPIFVARQWIQASHRAAQRDQRTLQRYARRVLRARAKPRTKTEPNQQAGLNRVRCRLNLQARRSSTPLQNDQKRNAYAHYQELLDDDVARELARINLPLSLYTEMYWQIDLNNLFHFLRLRLDSHAQYEIRVYGEVMAEMVKAVAPLAYEAFEEHSLYARRFSRSELDLLREALDMERLKEVLGASEMRKSRQRELLEKLESVQAPAKEPSPVS